MVYNNDYTPQQKNAVDETFEDNSEIEELILRADQLISRVQNTGRRNYGSPLSFPDIYTMEQHNQRSLTVNKTALREGQKINRKNEVQEIYQQLLGYQPKFEVLSEPLHSEQRTRNGNFLKKYQVFQTYDHYLPQVTENNHNPYSIEKLVASHPIFSRMSLMACQVIERQSEIKEYNQNQMIYQEDEIDDRVIFILEGEVSLNKRYYGKIAKINQTGTLGENLVLDVKARKQRLESACVESYEGAVTLELTRLSYFKIKEMLFEMGLRRDFLKLETILRKSLFLKRNVVKR